MTLWLPRDGRDVAEFRLKNPPVPGAPGATVELEGAWYPLAVEAVGLTDALGRVGIVGPDYTDAIPGGAVRIMADQLPRVDDDGVIRTDQWIRLRPA